MIELPYSLIIEATEEPDYFGFYSPDLEGFSGIGYETGCSLILCLDYCLVEGDVERELPQKT